MEFTSTSTADTRPSTGTIEQHNGAQPAPMQQGVAVFRSAYGLVTLRLDFNTLADAEAHMNGSNLMEIALRGTIGLAHVRAVLFAAGRMQPPQKPIRTLEDAGLLIQETPDGFTQMVEITTEAIAAAFPGKADAQGNP